MEPSYSAVDEGYRFGGLISLAMPETMPYPPSREALRDWDSQVQAQMPALGTHAVLDDRTRRQPLRGPAANINVWLDDAGNTWDIAMERVRLLVHDLIALGHSLSAVEVFDWAHNPILA